MAAYTVSSIPLSPISGIHNGTGDQHNPGFATVVPASVPGNAELQFVGEDVRVTTMLFALNSNVVVPNWFGVAVPDGIQDFTRPNIFFHPTPGQVKDAHGNPIYPDSAYPTKGAHWPDLFYYMERLGYQVAGAGRSQIVIMPFMTNTATDTGILPSIWRDTVTSILTQARTATGADDGSALSISQVVVSSFSDGIIYSHFFRARSSDLAAAEIWDLDGGLSSYRPYSAELETGPSPFIQYDSASPSLSKSFHLPPPRWAGFYDKAAVPHTPLQVHPLIRDFMFLDAASRSQVGSLIAAPAPSAVPQSPSPPGQVPAAPVAPPAAPIAGPAPAVPITSPGPMPSAPAVAPAAPVSPPGQVPVWQQPTVPAAPSQPPMGAPSEAYPGVCPPEPVPAPCMVTGRPAPVYPAGMMLPRYRGADCGVAITGIVATVATTAQAALAGITAIAEVADVENDH
jgi:hypothetical protein